MDSDLNIPESLLQDDNAAQALELPPAIAQMPLSSAPNYTIYRLLRHLRPTSALEIGTQIGASAFSMALAFRDNRLPVDITCVDPFYPCGDNDGVSTLSRWYSTIYGSGFKPGVQLYLSTSGHVLPLLQRSFDFVFIDGNHEYEHVREDCLLGFPPLIGQFEGKLKL